MNRYCFFFCILLLIFSFNVRISAMASPSLSDDLSKFETLIDLARKTVQTDSELALEYAAQALALGEEKQDQKMITQAFLTFASVHYDAQNFTKSIEYGKTCESFFEKNNDVESLAGLYNLLSSAYFYIGNAEMSGIYSDKCIELAEKHQILNVLVRQYYNRSAIAFYRDDYSYSMDFAFKALEIVKKINHPVYMAYCYDLLGNLSNKMAKYREAIQYYELSRKIYLTENDQKSIGQSYYNTAGVYLNLKQLDSVRLCYYQALDYYRKAESAEGLVIAYTGLANYYMSVEKLDSAQTLIGKGLKAALLSESQKDLSASYNTAGSISFQQGNYQKALEYYRKALFLAHQIGDREAESNAEQNLGRNFAATGGFDSAYYFLSHSIAIKDSINQLDEVQKRAFAFAEHIMKEKHEKEKETELLKRRLLLIIEGLCIMVIAILSMFIRYMYVRQRNIKSINAELNKYKADLELALQGKTRELILSEQQILNLSKNLPNGAIFRFSFENELDGKILFVSSGWEDLTGQSIEAIKDSLLFFKNGLHPDDSHELLEALTHAIRNHTILDMMFRFYKNSTELRWFHVRAMAITGNDGLTYLDGYLVDETQQKHFEQDLVTAKNKAEEADKLKSAFLANMSHEIRTPMNAIVGFSSLLSNEQLPPTRQASYLELVQENCQKLLHLIDNIVDVSKIEAGQLNLRKETFPLSKIMTTVKDLFEPIIDTGYPLVKLWIDEDLLNSPLTVHVDFLRLRQIFVNLIENALKFTEKGFVRCGYTPDREDVVHLYIMDTGSGISQENKDIIFQNFRKVDQYSDGTGLGLSIVKKILLQMGGDIWVESEPGIGSTFHFTLPIAK